jgi:Na+/H+ antiporter
VSSIDVVLAMLLAVVASGYVMRVLPFGLPLPLAQIVLGAAIAEMFPHRVILEPDVFFLLFLPPLLFLDGWRIPKDGLFRDKGIIIGLALGLVVFTVAGAGFLIHLLIPGMPLPVAFAFAAIVSPTDPVAVSSIGARISIPKRLMHILEGESLLNDASGLVCFQFAVAAALTGRFSFASASVTFLWVALVGLAIGVGFTVVVTYIQGALSRRLGEESGTPILISILIPFGAYLLAEKAHASGILAAVGAGMAMGYVELRGRALAGTRLQRAAVWSTVQFALNGIMFVLLGEQIPYMLQNAIASVETIGHHNRWWLAIYALAIGVGLTTLRFVWVWVTVRLIRVNARRHGLEMQQPGWRMIIATSLAGVRGAVTLAGVMTLPLLLPDGTPFPARELAIFLAAAVILLSLVVASFGLPPLLKGLELPPETESLREEDLARHEAATAAMQAIEQSQRDLLPEIQNPEILADAASRVIAAYQRRIDGANESISSAGQIRKADQAERALRVAGLRAERAKIFSLARERRISDEVSRKLVRELDLMETRQQ